MDRLHLVKHLQWKYIFLKNNQGPDNPNERSMGLIPRVMADLFEIINSDDELVYIIKVSFLEIYNEKIQDLLDANNTNLKIKEDRLRGIFVHNLTEVVV